MSKFIELTHKHSENKLLFNINKIEKVNVYEGDTIVTLNELGNDFYTVAESYEQVKNLIETENRGVTGNIAENTTINTQQAIEWLKQFDDKQVNQILEGIDDGVDVSLYAKLEFNWQQMFEIRVGQQHGVDVTLYANPNFYWKQMQQIRWGLQSGIDVTLYLDLNISWKEMQKRRLELEREMEGETK